jgi:hypothetical protein
MQPHEIDRTPETGDADAAPSLAEYTGMIRQPQRLLI